MKKNALILLLLFLASCTGMSGYKDENFPVKKKVLSNAIDSFYKRYPEYRIPGKWDYLNNWSEAGYDFLDSRIFYFKTPPEEMYYISFIGDSLAYGMDTFETIIALRAVCKGEAPEGHKSWLLQEDVNKKEKARIENRFHNEVVNKLDEILGLKQ